MDRITNSGTAVQKLAVIPTTTATHIDLERGVDYDRIRDIENRYHPVRIVVRLLPEKNRGNGVKISFSRLEAAAHDVFETDAIVELIGNTTIIRIYPNFSVLGFWKRMVEKAFGSNMKEKIT